LSSSIFKSGPRLKSSLPDEIAGLETKKMKTEIRKKPIDTGEVLSISSFPNSE
jgi:hypothetical protein